MLEVFPSARKCVYGFAMHSSTKKIKKREKSEKNTESIGGSAVASVLFLGVCGCVLLFVGFPCKERFTVFIIVRGNGDFFTVIKRANHLSIYELGETGEFNAFCTLIRCWYIGFFKHDSCNEWDCISGFSVCIRCKGEKESDKGKLKDKECSGNPKLFTPFLHDGASLPDVRKAENNPSPVWRFDSSQF